MSPRPIYLALYKGRRDGSGWRVWCARTTDWLTRVLTRGQYSHCEIAMRLPENDETGAALYDCYSASIRDGGVRWKRMPLPAEKWDLIDITADPLVFPMFFSVWEFTKGQPYDLMGAFGVVFNFRQNPRRWFCSEWCAGVLGLGEPWRFSPNDLAAIYQNSKAELLRRRK